MEAAARSEALRKLTTRALWWFRWAAVMTMASGLLMWAIAGSDYKPSTSLGLSITFGSILGLTMGANVWMVIWPNQKINIASAEAVAAGGQADPAAVGAAKLAGRVSRVNTFFSIPMLFFMVFTTHFAPNFRIGRVGGRDLDLFAIIWVGRAGASAAAGGLDSPSARWCRQPHQDDRGRHRRRRRALLHRLGAGDGIH
jgi:hypothetical protein